MSAQLRKLPILFLLVAGICAAFFFYSQDHQEKVLEGNYAVYTIERENELASFINLAHELGGKGLWDEMNQVLEEARLANRIDFYLLQYQGQALWFGGHDDQPNWYAGSVPALPDVQNLPKVSFRSEKIGTDYQLTVGIDKDVKTYVANHQDEKRLFMLQNGMFVFLIVLVVGSWTLKDIILMARQMRRGRRGAVRKLKTTTAEADVFMKSLSGYSSAIADLEAENVRLGRQVLPSLQKEIHSGRQPPYDFSCAMVRTDINHFSTIFNTHNVTEFMATINSFFDEVSRVVARYGGLIHEFVGDEVIYYFKDDEHENSFAMALSAIRDINEVAARYHAMTLTARGYPFTVKSSAAHGRVRFGPLVGGFTIAGATLIETVRILSHIQEKDESVVYFDGVNAHRLQGLIQAQERLHVQMKGYQNAVSLYQYSAHLPLAHILKTLNEDTVDQLLYYRSDRDLIAIIDALRTKAYGSTLELKAIRLLRQPHVARTDFKLGPSLRQWIEQRADAKVISAIVMLYVNLVPKSDLTQEDRLCLEALLKHEDKRVVANAVEALTHFTDLQRLPKSKKIADLRIAANTVVFEGRDEIRGTTIRTLNAFLKSKNANQIASGLYALGELALIHRKQDVNYFASHADFQNLIEQIPIFAQHTVTMVRRQALIAARKAASENVTMAIRRHVKDSGSELLKEELDRYLDSQTSSKASAA